MSWQDDQIDFEEALQLVMQRTGKSRRQARYALLEACRSGKLPATGINSETGEREIIPPSAFPIVQ